MKFQKMCCTNRRQSNKSVINRYRVVPSFEVCEKHCWEEDEDDNGWKQVNCDLTDQTELRWHPITIC